MYAHICAYTLSDPVSSAVANCGNIAITTLKMFRFWSPKFLPLTLFLN
jgi:hypothetical protein